MTSVIAEMSKREEELAKELKAVEEDIAKMWECVDAAEKKATECSDHELRTLFLKRYAAALSHYESCIKHKNIILAKQESALAEWNKGQIQDAIASSPVSKFLLKSIASAHSGSVYHCDFGHEKETTQSDRIPGLRKRIAQHYGVWKRTGDCKCQLSLVWGGADVVTASHLLKHATKNHLKEPFEINNINDPRNVIMLCKGIEKAFEAGRIYFVQGNSDRDFLLKVWDPSVVNEPIHVGATTTIGSLVGRSLLVPRNGEPPFKRVLSDHAQRSYKHALKKGWIEPHVVEPVEYGSPLKDNILSITLMNTSTDEDQSEMDAARTV